MPASTENVCLLGYIGRHVSRSSGPLLPQGRPQYVVQGASRAFAESYFSFYDASEHLWRSTIPKHDVPADKKKGAATGTASLRHALTTEFKKRFRQTWGYGRKRRRPGCPSHLWLASRSRLRNHTRGNRDFPVQSLRNKCSRFVVPAGLRCAEPSRVPRVQ
jgi:hypothetical protein